MSSIKPKIFPTQTVIASAITFMILNTFLPLSLPLQAETTKYPFKLVMTLEKTVFKLGEPVDVTCILTNISEENVTLYHSSDIPLDFLIRDENFNHVFRYSSYVGGPAARYPFTPIEPNDNKTRMGTWKQIYDGTVIPNAELRYKQVLPGTYYVNGIFTSATYGSIFSTPVIRIMVLRG